MTPFIARFPVPTHILGRSNPTVTDAGSPANRSGPSGRVNPSSVDPHSYSVRTAVVLQGWICEAEAIIGLRMALNKGVRPQTVLGSGKCTDNHPQEPLVSLPSRSQPVLPN